MADYHFQGLSPYDFELLVRDLLQAATGMRLEAFGSGSDRGIDLRYSAGPSHVVVQCKHYAHSDWPALKRALQSERPKLEALGPSRYIIATSMSLTPDRKSQILQLFAPFCLGPADVLGREDLNNLLTSYPSVETTHYKLWLTSIPVLSRVLNASIFSEQQAELDAIAKRISRFVVNPSVNRAAQALSDHHFVVITGVPGIGKTTLAEMLIVEHLSRDYECFRIWEGVNEARAVLQRGERQLFYFDDFLGRTGLRNQIQRNEDERLIRFIRDIARSENTRLILTTREYILHQAQTFMEGLRTGEIGLGRSVVDLGDYTPHIRAEILYNHLYFSDVPASHIETLISQRAYREIVRHRNYSPRILEAMTDSLNVGAIPAENYPIEFVKSLNNPCRIWQVAYEEHLTREAQDLLLVAATLPDRVRIVDVERAFDRFHGLRSQRYGAARSPYDWQRAQKELDGSFLKHELSNGEIMLEFHNPSARDFMESHIRQNIHDIRDLIEGATFAGQVSRLWQFASRVPDGVGPNGSLLPAIAARYWELNDSDSLRLYQLRLSAGRLRWQVMGESRLLRFVNLWDLTRSDPAVNRPEFAGGSNP